MATDEELNNLIALYSRGLLTDEEFRAAKASLRPPKQEDTLTSDLFAVATAKASEAAAPASQADRAAGPAAFQPKPVGVASTPLGIPEGPPQSGAPLPRRGRENTWLWIAAALIAVGLLLVAANSQTADPDAGRQGGATVAGIDTVALAQYLEIANSVDDVKAAGLQAADGRDEAALNAVAADMVDVGEQGLSLPPIGKPSMDDSWDAAMDAFIAAGEALLDDFDVPAFSDAMSTFDLHTEAFMASVADYTADVSG